MVQRILVYIHNFTDIKIPESNPSNTFEISEMQTVIWENMVEIAHKFNDTLATAKKWSDWLYSVIEKDEILTVKSNPRELLKLCAAMMLWMTAPKSKFLSKGTLGMEKIMGRCKKCR